MFAKRRTVRIARVFGIRIGASPSWFVVFFGLIYLLGDSFENRLGVSSATGYAVSTAAVVLFTASLLLHELGHALVARRLDMGVVSIDLAFFGGVARATRASDSPGSYFKVIAAGPAVTLMIAVVCGALATVLGGGTLLEVLVFGGSGGAPVTVTLLSFLATVNTSLLVFNLVPAFPLDGGQLVSALIWKLSGNRHRGTRVTGRIGQGFAYLLIAFAVFIATKGVLISGIYLAAVGWLLAKTARAAVASTAFIESIGGMTVGDIMDVEPVRLALPAAATARHAQDEYFGPHGWNYFPVVDELGCVLGVVTDQRIDSEIAAGRSAIEVSALIEAADAARWYVHPDRSVGSLLVDKDLLANGSLLAVSDDRVLRGVVTAQQLQLMVEAAQPQRSGSYRMRIGSRGRAARP